MYCLHSETMNACMYYSALPFFIVVFPAGLACRFIAAAAPTRARAWYEAFVQ
jgi:hypothetical protein